jgi:hypothetical protein
VTFISFNGFFRNGSISILLFVVILYIGYVVLVAGIVKIIQIIKQRSLRQKNTAALTQRRTLIKFVDAASFEERDSFESKAKVSN